MRVAQSWRIDILNDDEPIRGRGRADCLATLREHGYDYLADLVVVERRDPAMHGRLLAHGPARWDAA